jgi:hypothetical protein
VRCLDAAAAGLFAGNGAAFYNEIKAAGIVAQSSAFSGIRRNGSMRLWSRLTNGQKTGILLFCAVLLYRQAEFLLMPRSFTAGILKDYLLLGLYTMWTLSLRQRIVSRNLRRVLFALGALIVFWTMVRMYKYHLIGFRPCGAAAGLVSLLSAAAVHSSVQSVRGGFCVASGRLSAFPRHEGAGADSGRPDRGDSHQ